MASISFGSDLTANYVRESDTSYCLSLQKGGIHLGVRPGTSPSKDTSCPGDSEIGRPVGYVRTVAASVRKIFSGFKDGTLEEMRLRAPKDAVFDSTGSLYTVDTYNHAIHKITLN